MEAGTEKKPSERLPAGSPEGLRRAADRQPLSDHPDPDKREREAAQAEHGALDFLLGPTQALEFKVPVKLDTPHGEAKLIFVIRQMDGARILEIEDQNRKGRGPFADVDDIAFNAALVAEATVRIEDPSTGKVVDPASPEFIGGAVTPHDAMRARFKNQSGILAGVAGEVRRISGWGPDRVEAADRVLIDAVGNS